MKAATRPTAPSAEARAATVRMYKANNPLRRQIGAALGSIERFDALPDDDKSLLAALLAMWADREKRTVTSVVTYARRILVAVELLSEHHPELGVIFESPETQFELVGAFGATQAVRNQSIPAVKALLDTAVRLGLIDWNHLSHLSGKKIEREATPVSDQDVASAMERAVLMAQNPPSRPTAFPAALRDLALLEVMSHGLRAHEIAERTLSHFNLSPDDGAMAITESKSARGARTQPLSKACVAFLTDYLAALRRYRNARGLDDLESDSPVFWTIHGTPMSPKAVSAAVGKQLGCRAHSLRTRLGTLVARKGTLHDVAAALGVHPDTARHYIAKADAEQVRRAIAVNSAAALLSAPPGEHAPDKPDEFLAPVIGLDAPERRLHRMVPIGVSA